MPVPDAEWAEILTSFRWFIDNRIANLAPTVSNQANRLNSGGVPVEWIADIPRLSLAQRTELRALLNNYPNPKPTWVSNLRSALLI